ncbi:PilZ domain-containing protein [Pseudomonas duriflava]|uniref:PilZ domain-containing protein n=1 Tax=Pseudomonas duriflava TaxID=459528 RepID=A0A562Q9H0_9PSED|nr:PilZ domain-containing protein [Pseudomonas duriflava]TWI53402.1 PilZ domain-containing protein [Pseudomonas duriflava]
MTTSDADERREYYRITDSIALEITLLDGSASDAVPNASPLFDLLSEMHLLEFESQHLLRNLNERDRPVAACLKLFSKRLDLLGQALTWNLTHEIGEAQTVVLSEGGLSFTHQTSFPLGSLLGLRMILMPQGLGLQLTAEVIHCQESTKGKYEIGTRFPDISDSQRQLLARHIIKKQAHDRRTLRAQPGEL